MTPVGAGPEVIGANERGRLVPKADAPALAAALSELAADRGLGEELGRRGRDFVRRTSQVDAIVQQHERVYDDVLRLSRAPSLGPVEAGP
jgi:glycosyltransferase involved in cell wall biosynthesis